MPARIIVLDADRQDGAGLAAYLARHGLPTATLPAAEPVLNHLAAAPPDLVVIHRRLDEGSDLALLRRLRDVSPVPTILRAVDGDDEADRVQALELGADDYLPRGTSEREALARIRSVLRRARPAPQGWRLCHERRDVFDPSGRPCGLTSAEFELLRGLARQRGVPVSRDALSLAVLRRAYQPEDRALDNLVLRLRRKLGDGGARARLVKSVRGIGYVFTGFDAAPAEVPLLAAE